MTDQYNSPTRTVNIPTFGIVDIRFHSATYAEAMSADSQDGGRQYRRVWVPRSKDTMTVRFSAVLRDGVWVQGVPDDPKDADAQYKRHGNTWNALYTNRDSNKDLSIAGREATARLILDAIEAEATQEILAEAGRIEILRRLGYAQREVYKRREALTEAEDAAAAIEAELGLYDYNHQPAEVAA